MAKKNYKKVSASERKEQIGQLFENINKGIVEMFQSENFKSYLDFMASFHKYSTNNIHLILAQKPDATRVASFLTWKELKRSVKKGEKGIQILVPAPYQYFYEGDKIVYLSQATKEQKQKIDKGEIELKKGLSFKIGHVFDISQTEGEEVPTICKALVGNDEEAERIYNSLREVIEIPVIQEDTGSSKGYYSPSDNIIALNINNSPNQNAKTLVHEYTHSKLHKETDKDRNTAEVEAESTAYIVCKYFGFDTEEYSFGYVLGWSKGKEFEELKKSAETIQKTASEIIEAIESRLEKSQKTA